jgi:CRISPR-associated endonuclease/helicase Cas3
MLQALTTVRVQRESAWQINASIYNLQYDNDVIVLHVFIEGDWTSKHGGQMDFHPNRASQHEFQPIAHVHPDHTQVTHPLAEHVEAVARLAGKMAAQFDAEKWGQLAGRWHDLGKYSNAFQRYIRSASGFEAHLVDAVSGKVNHSSAGALHAKALFGNLGLPLAYLIAGHHAGLPDWSAADGCGNAALENRLRDDSEKGLRQQAIEAAPQTLLQAQPPVFQPGRFGGADGLHLWLRMLFSCLTDADFLDTEGFMDAGKGRQRGTYPELASLLPRFNEAMRQKTEKSNPSQINVLRLEVLRQCRQSATGATGLYTLTVPTGGGKTLSSLAFALDHAIFHGKSRIVYARALTTFLAARILAAGKIPFLHVKSENGAKVVYQKIGFRLRAAIYLTVLSLR